jgi:hypothetical protein
MSPYSAYLLGILTILTIWIIFYMLARINVVIGRSYDVLICNDLKTN